MACAAKFLRPLPKTCILISSSSSLFRHPKRFFYAKFEPIKSFPRNFRSIFCNRVSNFRFKVAGADRKQFQKSPLRGQLNKGTILGVSVVLGSIILGSNVSLAMDERCMEILQEDLDAIDIGKHKEIFWKLATKLWVPILFCLTVLTNLDQPLTLVATKVILFLLSTKPCPLSVYIFVDQLCNSSCQEHHVYYRKAVYASKVEVQDYKLVCVATVVINQQHFTLLGILGGWWALPSSTPVGEFNAFPNIPLKHRIYSFEPTSFSRENFS